MKYITFFLKWFTNIFKARGSFLVEKQYLKLHLGINKENAAYLFTICCVFYQGSIDASVYGVWLDETTYIFLWSNQGKKYFEF